MQRLLESDDPERTERGLRQLVTDHPEYVGLLLVLAGHLCDRGREDEAQPLLERAVADFPESVDLLNVLASLLQRRGEFEASERAARSALQIDDGNLDARMTLGGSLFSLRRFAESAAALRPVACSRHASARLRVMYLLTVLAAHRGATTAVAAILLVTPVALLALGAPLWGLAMLVASESLLLAIALSNGLRSPQRGEAITFAAVLAANLGLYLLLWAIIEWSS